MTWLPDYINAIGFLVGAIMAIGGITYLLWDKACGRIKA
jgi:hypothetical protein